MAVNKVLFNGSPVIDLTGVTVTPETLLSGYTAHDATGSLIVGTLDGTATDSSVPVGSGVSRVNYAGNALVDLTSDTVVPGALLTGVTAYSASGVLITGVFEPGVDVESMQISYTGNYTDEIKTMSDGRYRLLTLIGSGTLTLAEAVKCDVWMIGGGASGSEDYNGGAGGFSKQRLNTKIQNLVATIGARWSATETHGDLVLSTGAIEAYDGSGGTGGGVAPSATVGTGDGQSKYPFGDTDMTLVGGAGGSGAFHDGSRGYGGGAGGSNGGNGSRGSSSSGSYTYGGAGGAGGGGAGGQSGRYASRVRDGSDATLYGAGGGGGGVFDDGEDYDSGSDGSGYQGVCYIRIPLDQAA